jgi:hypothetical protein
MNFIKNNICKKKKKKKTLRSNCFSVEVLTGFADETVETVLISPNGDTIDFELVSSPDPLTILEDELALAVYIFAYLLVGGKDNSPPLSGMVPCGGSFGFNQLINHS